MNKRNLTRRELLHASGAVGLGAVSLAAAVPFSLSAARLEGAQQASGIRNVAKVTVALSPLKPRASGMGLALRVVGRYFGTDAVQRTAFQLEYQGQGWMDAKSNSVFAVKPAGDICAVCWMLVDRKIAPSEVYKGQTYYFCMKDHKDAFDSKPDGFVALLSNP
jgi:YHS domain-containing protein